MGNGLSVLLGLGRLFLPFPLNAFNFFLYFRDKGVAFVLQLRLFVPQFGFVFVLQLRLGFLGPLCALEGGELLSVELQTAQFGGVCEVVEEARVPRGDVSVPRP